MNIQQAKALVGVDIDGFDIEKLRRHRVKVLDAWRESKAEHGFGQAVKDGFYKVIASESASGFSPADIWLTHNLECVLDRLDAAIKELEEVEQ